MREEELSYTDEIYVRKCKQTDILPLKYTFFLYDMVFFHDILCSRIPLRMPQYLSFFDGNSCLRSTHLDFLSIVSNLPQSSTGVRNLDKAFYYRSHNVWNSLPLNIRSCWKKSDFKDKIISHFWEQATSEFMDSDHEDSFFASDDGG